MIKIKKEVKIGLFAIIMLVCLYLGVNYLKGRDVFSRDVTYYALFDQTRGLQTSASVLLRGVKVGTVSQIELSDGHPDKVLVTVTVKKSVPIPIDSRLKLYSSDLMGGKAVELVMGAAAENFAKRDTIPAEIEAGLVEEVSNSLGDIVAQAKKVLSSIETTSNSLNTILEQNTAGIKGVVDGADVALRDLGQFSAMLRRNSGKFESIVGNLDNVAADVAAADLRGTIDSLGSAITSLNGVLAKVSAGEGTAARLINDPALYDSLTVATGNLAVLLEDLKANPGRYVHLSLFGRKEKKEKAPKEKKQ